MTANALSTARAVSPVISAESEDALTTTVFRGVMSSLDRYSRYSGPESARRNRASREGFGGIGIAVQHKDGITRVSKVHPNTPASRAGLLPGDRITHVDGEPITGKSRIEVVRRLRGPVGSTIALEIARGAERGHRTISITRTLIVFPTVKVRHRDGLLIIKVSGFNHGTSADLSDALSDAERRMGRGLKGIILDLRGNPGGLLDQAVAVADLFLVRGRVISTIGRHPNSYQIFDATWGELAAHVPLVVLINGKSASAAEIVAVALRDQGRAIVIGSASYGKGTVQTIVHLPNDGELTLTWARMMAPSGYPFQGNGIIPAICTSTNARYVSRLLDALRRGDDSGFDLVKVHLKARMARRHHPDEARKACPPTSNEPDSDIEIASALLGDQQIFNHALYVGRPAVAERSPRATAERP